MQLPADLHNDTSVGITALLHVTGLTHAQPSRGCCRLHFSQAVPPLQRASGLHGASSPLQCCG